MNDFLPLASELTALAGPAAGGSLTEENAAKAVQSLAYVLKDSVPQRNRCWRVNHQRPRTP
ncbi:hypothetical protein [Arthrobacter sp. fls2-241-R2A-200]|uniref:hypothetical protein n=1 Tax=unclassified Arthrobacter TaxID=235627 RepID=UPI00254BCC24|nr:hypothetical protein [Arthrobacter sp. fls2-241-R2A-200]